MRKKIIAANWKMNILPSETFKFIENFKNKIMQGTSIEKLKNNEVVFCVPFLNAFSAVAAVQNTDFKIGAQNLNENEKGAYTGEVSADMIVDIGIRYVIIGHSERREIYGETDEIINKKLKSALNKNLVPILCVGEKLTERENNTTKDIISNQLKIALQNINIDDVKNIVIAYEPVWAIGTGKTATKEQAEEICAFIRNFLIDLYGNELKDISILYGGSVNGANAKEIFEMENIDGGLIGGASLKDEFLDIVNAI
ncbi:MAG: triose-phosphate isomerase [Defluviitaleaceae bacterium]|nr:triose-phosphate isomerase [Defluviitaleaceae bacterium]